MNLYSISLEGSEEMSIFQRLFGKKKAEQVHTSNSIVEVEEPEWEELEGFVPVEAEEAKPISVIAASIAANDNPESQFVVKRILKRNPDTKIISVIASAIAAGEAPDSQWAVKKIYRKRK